MPRGRRSSRTEPTGSAASKKPISAIDLGLSLSVYGKDADGALYELGAPESPLSRQSAAGTWPTEQ